VKINGETVWENGEMVSHSYVGAHNAEDYTLIYGAWAPLNADYEQRSVSIVCSLCGFEGTSTETRAIQKTIPTAPTGTELAGGSAAEAPETPLLPPQTGDGNAVLGIVMIVIAALAAAVVTVKRAKA